MAQQHQTAQQPFNFLGMLIEKFLDPNDLIAKYRSVKTQRNPWEVRWQMIQDQTFPDYRDYQNPGATASMEPKSNKIKSHSSSISGKINKVVSLLSAQLSDPASKWLHLRFSDEKLNEVKAASDWLSDCTEALYNLFSDPTSNFYPSTFSFHLDWYSLGTSCREIILRQDTGRIQFNTISMQNIYVDISGYGDIDTTYRAFSVTPKQAFDLWGERIGPTQMRLLKMAPTAATPSSFEYVEITMPNPLKKILPTLDYISCVVNVSDKTIVDYALHHHSPYVVSRFFVAPGETYGRSYVWYSMPDIAAINRLSKRVLQGIDFATMPVNLVQNASSIVQAQITPGAFIQGLDSHGNPMIQPMALGSGNVPMAMDFYTRKLADLDESLVATEVIPPENPNMTATEINERKIQASNRMRPLLVRLETEDLGKTILRTMSLMQMNGTLPEFPYEELGIDPMLMMNPLAQLRVTFSGQLAKMQKMQEVVNNDMIFQKALQAAQVNPEVLDRIKLDQLIVKDAEIFDVSPEVMATDEEVQVVRDERRAQQQQMIEDQRMNQAMETAAKMKGAGLDGSNL